MQVIKYPTQQQLAQLLQRPADNAASVAGSVAEILNAVKSRGDAAVLEYTRRFDHAAVNTLAVSRREINGAANMLPRALKKAIRAARLNILKFHKQQLVPGKRIETTPGVVCWRENRAIQSAGIYIPGGNAPLFSTVLMLAVPAQIAGCSKVILCSPPGSDGNIHPAILYAAGLCGVTEIYRAGGAQAIAAMAFGTETIPKADKIFGPGNRFVTTAKQMVQNYGVTIDMPAGPSEVMVVADHTADADFVAADLLSQAEHGPDSQVILVALNQQLVTQLLPRLSSQLHALPRRDIAAQALQHSKAIVVRSKAEALRIINQYAPEHLILAVKEQAYYLKHTHNAGSVFLGNYTPESAGDYASGTNHTLPTNGFARSYAGVSVDSFIRKMTVQKITRQGIVNLGNTIETMAAAEGLHAHMNAVSVRLKKIRSNE
jgi:histidinol dehydrogenase